MTTTEGRPTFSKPPLSLLLLLRFAILLLLVVILAGPTIPAGLTGEDHWLLVLDASGSMEATDLSPSRFVAALAQAETFLDGLPWRGKNGVTVSVIAVTGTPWIAAARLDDQADLRAALQTVTPSHTSAAWEEAAGLVRSLVLKGEVPHVLVFTDPTGRPGADRALTDAVSESNVQSIVFGSNAENLAMGELKVTPPAEGTQRWTVQGTVEAFGRQPKSVPLSVWYDPGLLGTPLLWSELKLAFDEQGRSSFSAELDLPDGGLLELRLPPDVLAYDNHTFALLYAEPRRLNVLYVGAGNEILRRLFGGFPYVSWEEAAVLPRDSERYDLVVVDSVTLPRRPRTHTLWLEASPPGITDVAVMSPADPSAWRNNHPLIADVDLGLLSVERALAVPKLEGASVLLEASEAPLIQARHGQFGKEVVVGFSLNDSNWSSQLSLVVFLDNLARWLLPDVGVQVSKGCKVAERCPLDLGRLHGHRQLLTPQGQQLGMRPHTEASQRFPWLSEDLSASFIPNQSGVYRLVGTDKSVPLPVAPVMAREGSLSSNELQLADTPVGQGRRGAQNLLWWLLILVLALLIVELWLSFRGKLLAESIRFRWLRHNAGALVPRLATIGTVLLALFTAPWLFPDRTAQLILILEAPLQQTDADSSRMKALREQFVRELGGQREGAVVWVGDIPPEFVGLPSVVRQVSADNLDSAFETALALLSPGRPGRLLVVAGGGIPRSETLKWYPRLVTSRVPVDVFALGGPPRNEVWVRQFSAPEHVYVGDRTVLDGVVTSTTAGPATVRVRRNGRLLTERTVTLAEGENRFEFPLAVTETGSSLYEFSVTRKGDTLDVNNERGVVVDVRRTPKVTIYAEDATSAGLLQYALEVHGIVSTVLPPNRSPHYMGYPNPSVPGWLDSDVVVLMDLPAVALAWSQQELLERWVREHGGGLLLLGGENTFGPGGYYQTILEKILPLSTKIPDEKPTVAICFVIDRSGSMVQPVGEVTRLDVAKRATLDAVELLDEKSLVSVVTFDSEAQALIPLQPVGTLERFREKLEPLNAGGGTSIYPGLVLAQKQIARADPELTRHIVVMTDGLSQPGEFEEIIDEIVGTGTTVSTAAIGQGADVELLKLLAQLGEGVSHATTDFEALPSILAQETLLLSDELVKTEPIMPVWKKREAPFLEGLDDRMPRLRGHVLTTGKPGADIHLATRDEDPLLASWRYGLGRVIAFASQGAGPWSSDWVNQNDYPLLWAQATRWLLPPTVSPGWLLRTMQIGNDLRVVAEALTLDGKPDVGLAVKVDITSPRGEHEKMPLREVAPGRYEAIVRLSERGTYQLNVQHAAGGQIGAGLNASFHHGFDSLYAFDSENVDRLYLLARLTGGRVVRTEPLWIDRAPWVWVQHRVWRPWMILAFIAFVAALLAPVLATFGRNGQRSERSLPLGR